MKDQRGAVIAFIPSPACPAMHRHQPVERLTALGWQLVLAGEGEALATDRDICLLDLRGQHPDRIGADLSLCDGVIALIDQDIAHDQGSIDALVAVGVGHILPWPCDDEMLDLAVRTTLAQWQARTPTFRSTPVRQDALTGLLSRDAGRQRLKQALEQGEAGGVSCLLLGISQFDSINAAYGKTTGDAVLVQIARRITHLVEQAEMPGAFVARMGGTEYLVAIPHEAGGGYEAIARDLARLLLSDVARPFVAEDNVVRLTARCGIAESVAGDDVARLLRRTSAALADARRSVSADIWFRSGVRSRGRKSSDADRLDADLRLALDRGEIAIVYQPQYDSHQDIIVGVEALARWHHPELGLLDAGTLFAAADRSDYLLPLSLHIQRTALTQAGQWPDVMQQIRLSINVTSVDLAQDDFLDQLLGMVAESGFPPERLTVEITESGLIENIDRAAAIMDIVRSKGIRVAIDDFGTGYSSLAYLKALYPDYLKIDHSLSRDILGTERDRIILRAIIAMSRSLALTVIAEGVESEEQLTLLAREGCDIYQGFLRSAAVSSAELVDMLSKA